MSKTKRILAALALAAGGTGVAATPAVAHHEYQPPNSWLCNWWPFLCDR